MLTDDSQQMFDVYRDTEIHPNISQHLWNRLDTLYDGTLSVDYDVFFRAKCPERSTFQNIFLSKEIEDTICSLRNQTKIPFSFQSNPEIVHTIIIHSKDECLQTFVIMIFHCVSYESNQTYLGAHRIKLLSDRL